VKPRLAFIICASLCLLFGLLSWSAIQTKSATMDEPVHFTAAFTHRFLVDFRLDPEDPPLWQYWMMLPFSRQSMAMDRREPHFANAGDNPPDGIVWTVKTLYLDGTNDGLALINRARAMMVLLGVGLCAVTCWFAFKLAGSIAAVTVAIFFTFDPNFLAHAGVLKNDVAISLMLVLLSIALSRTSLRFTIWNGIAVGLICALAMSTKFSGVLFPVIALLTMIVVFGRCSRRPCIVAALAFLTSFPLITWASYGFRFRPASDPNVHLNMTDVVQKTARNDLRLKLGRIPTNAEVAGWKPSLITRAVRFADAQELLPQSWLVGFLYTYQSSLVRDAYLMGHYSDTGWWYYFPLAMLFKTPVATIVSALLAMLLRICRPERSEGSRSIAAGSFATLRMTNCAWCLVIPPVIYMLSAMTSHLNIGVRHVLPVYPFLLIGIGITAARLMRLRPRATRTVAIVLGAGLALETLASYPDFISFFNVVCGGARGGYRLLGDSNLDWGQDLPLLGAWQRAHPNTPLYLAYFGSQPPSTEGIEFQNMPGGYWLAEPKAWPDPARPGVIAVSATVLQGIYRPDLREQYDQIRKLPLREVLGGSIYLFEWNPSDHAIR
jgi:hypothetical protein